MKRSTLMILSSLVLSTALTSAFAAGNAPVTALNAQVAPTRLDPAARFVKPEHVKPTEAAPGGQVRRPRYVKPTEAAPGGQAAQTIQSRRPQRGPRAGHPALHDVQVTPPKPGQMAPAAPTQPTPPTPPKPAAK